MVQNGTVLEQHQDELSRVQYPYLKGRVHCEWRVVRTFAARTGRHIYFVSGSVSDQRGSDRRRPHYPRRQQRSRTASGSVPQEQRRDLHGPDQPRFRHGALPCEPLGSYDVDVDIWSM